MRFFITCDSFWEAQVDKVIDRIDDTGYKRYFSEQDYGTSLDGITVVLMCQAPNLNLKQRIRLSKKEKKIYLDIMLDLPHFLEIAQKDKEKIIVDKLIAEIPPIITKYKLEDFNLAKFETDLENWMSKIL
ncbi:MAG TPA: hypothetical protein PKD16_16945 [Saprospiraceae bacterium]|jgi:hypothetical protein|nr:hypothetical protein [Saprospiraceae bacterium]HMT71858.1 hypothetical protein [Saprospiraceae bacterium]